MLRSVQRSIGLKLAIAIAMPALAIALAGSLWLRHATGALGVALEPAFGVVIGALVVFAFAMAVTHLLASRLFADLRARRLEDAASIESMRRELLLKSQLEARVRELTLLHDLSRALASTLEPAGVIRHLEALVGRNLRLDGLHVRVAPAPNAAGPSATPVSTPPLPPDAGAAVEVQMLHDGGRVGSLLVFRSGPEFSAEEVSLLESIASQAALALTNARLHQETVQLSRTDPLTSIANRRALFDRLQFEIERCGRFDETLGVVLVDVDHFKRLNDRFGHTGGDAVLRDVAMLLARCLRKVDHVARYGGEEFAILLPGADRAAALAVGEKLRAAIAGATFEFRGEPSDEVVTISVGVAVFPIDARDLSALVDCADAALYAAKRAGRNAVRAHADGMREHPGRERDVSITADVEPPER